MQTNAIRHPSGRFRKPVTRATAFCGAALAMVAPSWSLQAPPQWRLLVTHEAPSKAQRKLLSIGDREELGRHATELACLTMDIDGCTVIYPENLFNLRSVRERTKTLHKLSLFEEPTSTRSLSEEDRNALLALLTPADPQAAVALGNPDAHFAFGVTTELELKADGKSVYVPLGDAYRVEFPKPFPRLATNEEQRRAEAGALRAYALPPINEVIFTVEDRQVQTVERLDKIERFSRAIQQEVAEQAKVYARTVDAIHKRWSDMQKLPKVGDAVDTFSKNHRSAMASQMELNYRSYGFASAEEAKSFLEKARMAGVRQRCNFITAGIDQHNQSNWIVTEIRVRRSPP